MKLPCCVKKLLIFEEWLLYNFPIEIVDGIWSKFGLFVQYIFVFLILDAQEVVEMV